MNDPDFLVSFIIAVKQPYFGDFVVLKASKELAFCGIRYNESHNRMKLRNSKISMFCQVLADSQ